MNNAVVEKPQLNLTSIFDCKEPSKNHKLPLVKNPVYNLQFTIYSCLPLALTCQYFHFDFKYQEWYKPKVTCTKLLSYKKAWNPILEKGSTVLLLLLLLCRRTGAQKKGSLTPRGQLTFNLCPAEFWSLCSAPHRVLNPSFCAPQSFEAMQILPCKLMEM